MELADAIAFARQHSQGVLTTLRRDGRPQLSNIIYGFDGDRARISVTEGRAKTRNLRRDPRACLYIPGDSFWSYVVLDGTIELSDVARDPDDEVVDQLVALYRDARGEEHPDWREYRQAMATEGRMVASLHPVHGYGIAGQ
jgi:PPOX class probable F420-dependent enzyme